MIFNHNTDKEIKIEYVVKNLVTEKLENSHCELNMMYSDYVKVERMDHRDPMVDMQWFLNSENGEDFVEYLKEVIYKNVINMIGWTYEECEAYRKKNHYEFYALIVNGVEVVSRTSLIDYYVKEKKKVEKELISRLLKNKDDSIFKDYQPGTKNIEYVELSKKSVEKMKGDSLNKGHYLEEFKDLQKIMKSFFETSKIKIKMSKTLKNMYVNNFKFGYNLCHEFGRTINISNYPAWEHSYRYIRAEMNEKKDLFMKEGKFESTFWNNGIKVYVEYKKEDDTLYLTEVL